MKKYLFLLLLIFIGCAIHAQERNNAKTSGKSPQVSLFASDAVNLVGYRIEDDSYSSHADRGFIEFLSDNAGNVTQIKDYQPAHNATLIQAGEYVNGYWYYFSIDEDTYFPFTVPVAFVKLSTETYEEVSTTHLTTDAYVPRDMTYDFATEKMYGIDVDYLVTINLTTGALTNVGNFGLTSGRRMATIACNLDGDMYGVDTYGNFYTVNKATGAATFVVAMGVQPDYLQSMTFDHFTGRLFWAMRQFDNSGSSPRVCKLLEIEKETGTVIDLGVLGGNAQLVGLYSIQIIYNFTYEITASVNGGNGSVEPEGVITVNQGESQTFTFTPNADYEIHQVLIDGVTNTNAIETGLFTFENVTENHTIEVSFKFSEIIDTTSINENCAHFIRVFSYSNIVTIINKDTKPIKQIEVIDLSGRIVWRGHASREKTEIPLDVPTGAYIVRVINIDNQRSVTKITIK